MLSYRHAYHAGNFADVMKHVVLTSILKYLVQKDTKLCYIDTHAGAGAYELDSVYAQQTGEFGAGIARLWQSGDAPAPVADYLDLIRRFNGDGELRRYPGSPWIAAQIVRPGDRLVLCELHGSDLPMLRTRFSQDRRVHCHQQDGYQFTLGLLPPLERRGCIFMDPSYELRDEYQTAVAAVTLMHRRFATGTFALWYPVLNKHRVVALRQQFVASGMRNILHLALNVASPGPQAGMTGCGIIVVNPPWTLRDDMQLALPYLVEKMSTGRDATYRTESWVDE